MTEYLKIGKIKSIHGTGGALILEHSLGEGIDEKMLTVLFLEENNQHFIPWFIEEIRMNDGKGLYIQLEEIRSKEAAKSFLKKDLWMKKETFDKLVNADAPIALLGYMAYNKNELLGEIEEVVEQPHQLLCRVVRRGIELLLPVHENTIQKIDHKKRQLILELPEGLLEVYEE